MGRIRTIKPAFFLDEDLAYLPPLSRLLFVGLWTLADREGRLEDRPRRIKAEILPYDDVDVDDMLDQLAATAFIERFEVDGERFIAIPSFLRHQIPNRKEAPSVIPEPCKPAKRKRKQVQERNSTGTVPEQSQDSPGTAGREGKGREGNIDSAEAVPEQPSTPPTPPLLIYPTAGNPRQWELRQEFFNLHRDAYPGLDLMAEARKALSWVVANPSRKKTASGMPAFLVKWFNRATNDVRLRSAQTAGTSGELSDYAQRMAAMAAEKYGA